jgi:ubiquinone/menaquinone biosynthesis C-methylase UbiE
MRQILGLRRLWQSARAEIEVHDGSAEALPVPSDSVDSAWAINAVHHFDDLSLAADELARVLRGGGRLLLIEENFTRGAHTSYSSEYAHKHGPDPVDPDRLNELLTRVGLTVTESGSRTIGGVNATVITASKLLENLPTEDTKPGSGDASR